MEEKITWGHLSEIKKNVALIKTRMLDFIGGTEVGEDTRQIGACSQCNWSKLLDRSLQICLDF